MEDYKDINVDDMFGDKVLARKLRWLKIKQIISIVSITIVVVIFIILNLIKFSKSSSDKIGKTTIDKLKSTVRLSVKGGEISEAIQFREVIGGKIYITVSKYIENIPVKIYDEFYKYGLSQNISAYSYGLGRAMGGEEWSIPYYENGYRKLEFFSPEFEYLSYRNDFKDIEKIGENKILEAALSFDRPYSIDELDEIQEILGKIAIKFIWLNEFTDEIKEFTRSEINGGFQVSFSEEEVVGLNYWHEDYTKEDYEGSYEALVKEMENSYDEYYLQLAKKIKEGSTPFEEAKVLGVVVHGDQEDIEKIKDLPFIRAAAIGVIVEK